jgi:hypothetical protein
MSVLQLLSPLTRDAWASAASAAWVASVATAAAAAFASQASAAVLVKAPLSTRGQWHRWPAGAAAVARRRAARRVVLAGVTVANGHEELAGVGSLPCLPGRATAASGRAVACGRWRAHRADGWDPLRLSRQGGVGSSRQDRRRARAGALLGARCKRPCCWRASGHDRACMGFSGAKRLGVASGFSGRCMAARYGRRGAAPTAAHARRVLPWVASERVARGAGGLRRA